MPKKKEEKQKKIHDALLKFYHPTPPQPSPPSPPQNQRSIGYPKNLFDEEPSMLLNEDMNFDLDPVIADEEVEEEKSTRNTSDCEPKKLTRAQRKRIRKRKLKEAASVQREYTGPVLPSNYRASREEHCGKKKKTFRENNQGHMPDTS